MTAKPPAKDKEPPAKGKEPPAKGKEPPAKSADLSVAMKPEALRQAYRTMLSMRRFEELAGRLYGQGLIGGFCHLYIGQEAVATGVSMAARKDDFTITGYRDHGHMLACGMKPERVMAELTGRADGYAKGKGGSMHMFAPERGFYGGHGIVGAQVSLGVGLGLAAARAGKEQAAITYFGDGAANQGQVYESFNMAALWRLPVVFVIENNMYAMGTRIDRSSANADLAHRGLGFGIPGEQVDGMDVEAVYATSRRLLDAARSGAGPQIMEAMTYRYRGHSMSDPGKYRDKEEIEKTRAERDPLARARARLVALKLEDAASLEALDKAARAGAKEAADFAKASPEPEAAALFEDVLLPLEGEAS